MKSILISSFLVSAALAAPFIARDGGSATVQLKTGDSDESIQVTVPLDTVFSTANDTQAQVGVNAVVVDVGPTCRAFSDNSALKPLGGDFTSTVTGVFTSSNGAGDVGSNNQGVPIGAFFCSLSKAAVDAQVAKGSSSSTTAPPPSSTSSATVRVQNTFDNFDTSTQEDIPINTLYKTDSLLGNASDQLSIVSATGVDVKVVSCQAFKDVNGKTPIGTPFTDNKTVVLSSTGAGVTINAIKCTQSG